MPWSWYIGGGIVVVIALGTVLSKPHQDSQQRKVGQPSTRNSPLHDKLAASVSQICTDLAQQGVTPDNAAAVQAPQRFSSSLLKVDQHARIQVYIELTSVTDAVLTILRQHSVEIELVNEQKKLVQGWLPCGQLEPLTRVETVQRSDIVATYCVVVVSQAEPCV